MFIAVLIVIALNWEQPKCPLMREQLNRHWYVHIMEYHSAIRKEQTIDKWNNLDGPQGHYAQ